jgi:hypothetical protein
VPWAPLRCLFPVAGLGWELLVDPWATGALTPSNRVVTVTVAIPAVPALVGGTLRHQVFQFQSGVGRAWTGLSATNAVDLAVGRV